MMRRCLDCHNEFLPAKWRRSRCVECERARQAARHPSGHRFTATGQGKAWHARLDVPRPEWRRLRRLVLARDPKCLICLAAKSTDADHILPRAAGGLSTLANLRGLCRPCHKRRGGVES